MSVSTLTAITSFTGNNSTSTLYSIPWTFLDNSFVQVDLVDSDDVITSLTNGSDYSVTGSGSDAGGSFITTLAYDNTYTLKAYRVTAENQLTVYTENDTFPAESHETALDKLTMLHQEIKRQLGQCLQVTSASDTPAAADGVNLMDVFYGVDSGGSYKFLNAAEALAILELGGSVIDKPTASWADTSARAAKVPDFLGQVGTQQDTNAVYVSDGLTAGDWSGTVSSISANSVGLTEMAHTFGNDKFLGFSATGVPEAVSKTDFVSLADVGTVTETMMGTASVNTNELIANSVGLAKIAHSFGNSKLLGFSDSGVPEVVDKLNYRNSLVYIKDEKSSGTNGGTFTTGAWRTRDLNVKTNDSDSEYSIRSWAFTSGGTYELVVGDVITGATSTETATIFAIVLSSGSWAGGDAAGTVWLNDESGTFTSGEDLDVSANLNVLTGTSQPADADAIRCKAGTYQISASAPAYKVASHGTRLYDVTGAAALIVGTVDRSSSSDGVTSRSFIDGSFIISVESTVRVEHQGGGTQSANGFGAAGSFQAEVYTQLSIQKIA